MAILLVLAICVTVYLLCTKWAPPLYHKLLHLLNLSPVFVPFVEGSVFYLSLKYIVRTVDEPLEIVSSRCLVITETVEEVALGCRDGRGGWTVETLRPGPVYFRPWRDVRCGLPVRSAEMGDQDC